MSNSWPKALLGDVLDLCDSSVPVSELGEVNLAGVYSFGRGLFRRGSARPAETSYRIFNRLSADDFVISMPKAWEGAVALVTPEFDGWYLSPVFPTFRPRRSKIDPRFLSWFCKQPAVWEQLRRKSRGIGARRESVSPEQFLSLQIPLPSLSEQRAVVERLDCLASRTKEVQTLHNQTAEEARAIVRSKMNELIADAPWSRIAEVAPLVRRPVEVQTDGSYPELGVRSFGKGTFHKASLSGASVGSKRLFRIEPGDLVFNNVFAWEGAVAVAKPQDAGRVGSHRFITCVPRHGTARAEFLLAYFLTERGLADLGAASPGGAGRNRTLGVEALQRLEVPVPTMQKQDWFVRLQNKIQEVLMTQDLTGRELEGLLASAINRSFNGESVGAWSEFQSHLRPL